MKRYVAQDSRFAELVTQIDGADVAFVSRKSRLASP